MARRRAWVIGLAGLIVLLVGDLWALDEGGLKPGLGVYYSRFQSGDVSFSLQERFAYTDFYQHLTNYGRLEGRLGWAAVQDTWRRQDYLYWLSLKEVYLGQAKADLTLGDQATTISSLPLFFSNIFYPPQYFRGLSLACQHPAITFAVLAGSVTRSFGYYSETYQSLGERLVGGSWSLQPWDPLRLEGNLYLTRHETGVDDTVVTRRNTVYRLAGLYQTWRQLFLAGEFMQSFNTPVGQGPQQDQAYRAGFIWPEDRFRLEANYRYLGPNFHLINNLFLPDNNVKGYFLAGQASPWGWLSFYGSYNSASNNLVPQANQVVSETEFRSAGLRLSPPVGPCFSLNYYASNIGTRSDFPVQWRGRTVGLYSEVNWRRQRLEPYARYEQYSLHQEQGGVSDYRRQTPILGIRGYHQKVSWYGEGQYDAYRPRAAGQGYQGLYLRAGGSYYPRDQLYLFAEVSFRPESRRLGCQFGLNYRLPRDLSLRAYGRLEQGTMGRGDFANSFVSNQINVEITKSFSWGQKTQIAGAKPGQEWLGSGSIEGHVFHDLNQNGRYDPGEPGFAGVTVRLQDGSVVTTNEKGYYRFPGVAAGTTTVILETKRVPAKYTFLGEQTSTLEIRRRVQAQIDFPFILGADLRGRVVAAATKGREGQGLPNILVLAQPGDHNTFTDEEGYFAFLGLPPGSYELSLHPESLPPHAVVTGPPAALVTLEPGAKSHLVQFKVNTERPVLILAPSSQAVR